jgi:Ulp1 family protease
MELVNERSKKLGAKVHCFSSIFYAFLSEKGFSYHRVQRWTRRIDVFAMDRVIFPIHLGSHWCLAVINFKEKKFEYYDSLGSPNEKCVERLRRWVQEESMDKKKVPFDVRLFFFFFLVKFLNFADLAAPRIVLDSQSVWSDPDH